MDNGSAATLHDNSAHGEDSFLSLDLGPGLSLDAVLDGVTHCQGGYASGFTAQLLREASISSREDLMAVLDEANKVLYQSGQGRSLLTTISAALKVGSVLYVVNAGDSPIYLVRGGQAQELSIIATSGSLLGPVSGTLASREIFTCSSREVDLEPGDRLVLVTDGLTHNVTPQEMADIVSGAPTPDDAATALGELVAEKRRLHTGRPDTYGTFKEDDRTAVIRCFG